MPQYAIHVWAELDAPLKRFCRENKRLRGSVVNSALALFLRENGFLKEVKL